MKLFGFGHTDLKKEADEHIIKGNYAKALTEYQKIVEKAPENIRNRKKLADIYFKLQKSDKAIEEYTWVAEKYATEGFLIKAIAVNKIIIRLDPDNQVVKETLASLYTSRGINIGPQAPQAAASGNGGDTKEDMPTIPLFSNLSHAAFCKVVDKLIDKEFKKGDVLCREGENGDSIFIISEGEVLITRKDSSGKVVTLAQLSDGDFFGEFAFFSKSSRLATVVANQDTNVFEMTNSDIDGVIEEFPSVKEVLFDFYKERVIANLMAISPVFSPLSKEEKEEVIERFKLKNYKIGEAVIKEGDAGDSIFLIKSGRVMISTTKDGKTINLAKLNAGDFFGEIALVTGKPRTATVTAETQAEILELKKVDFDDMLVKHSEINGILQDYLKERAKKTISTVMNFEKESRAKNKMV
ncbi:cyclic nucleotide-binding domain-containing protein [Thermodesulfobacteriota bacterium]